MDIDKQIRGEVAVIACTGRLTMVSAPDLRSYLAAAVAEGPTTIVTDLAGTSFIDSSGLGALISGLKEARKAGGDLRIARPTEQVATVLSLTSLDKVLRPYATVEEAIDAR